MKTGKMELARMILLGLGVVQMSGAQTEDAEPAPLASLTLQASQWVEQTGGRLSEEGLALAPAGRAACVLSFTSNQVYTFVLMARGETEPWPCLEVRLNDRLAYAGAVASSNWSSYAFTQAVAPGQQKVEILNRPAADQSAGSAVLQVASLTVMAPDGVPPPGVATPAVPAKPPPVATVTGAVPVATGAGPAATSTVPAQARWDAPVGR